MKRTLKRPLTFKFFISYILCILSVILFSSIFVSGYINKYISNKTKSTLYTYAQFIETNYFSKTNDLPTSYINTDLAKELQQYDSVLNTHVWITNASGTILVNTENIPTQNKGYTITSYDKNFFNQFFYKNKTISPILTDSSFMVTIPVTINYSIGGYIVVFQSMDIFQQEISHYERIVWFVILGISIILALLLIYCWFITIRPSKKIVKAISSYTSGNYDYVLSLHGKDEYEQIETELTFLAEQLRDLDDYQKNFIANVSHDFRSPLTSIKGYAIAMQDGTIPPELYNKYLDIIAFETERLTKLTSNLLSLNSFERGMANLEISSFDINHIIKRTASTFEGTCTKKHIKLNLTFSERETFVNADEAKIQQVLYNLIDNAIKFSHKDSEIRITTIEKKEKVLVSVKDFGIGIPKNSLKKIWERFYKTDLSRGKDQKGTGLGLSITKEIINAHNENINVTSTEGAGTEFSFALPLTTPNEI